MKRYFAVAVLMFAALLPGAARAQCWEWQWDEGPAYQARIDFVSSTEGWLLSSDRPSFVTKIRHTMDGGVTWTVQDTFDYTFNEVTGLDFIDNVRGWISLNGSSGSHVFRTTDGGESWISPPGTEDVGKLAMLNESVGWAIWGDSISIVERTTDGGTSWASQYLSGEPLYDLEFVDLNNGWVVGNAGTILHTTNGGVTWEAIAPLTPEALYGIDFGDLNHGCIVGNAGTILRTSDGGASWQTPTHGLPVPDELDDVVFSDLRHGWALGQSTHVYRTVSGGASWYDYTSFTSSPGQHPGQVTKFGQDVWALVFWEFGYHSIFHTLNNVDSPRPIATITSLPFHNFNDLYWGCADNSADHCYPDVTGPDASYYLTLNCGQMVTVSTCGSTSNTALEVRTGGAYPGTTSIVCNDDFCGNQAQLEFAAQPNELYYIIVSQANYELGSYDLNVTGAPLSPPNDNCPGMDISNVPSPIYGCTSYANNSITHCNGGTSPDVFYNFYLSEARILHISLLGSGFNTALELRGGCSSGTTLACSDPGAPLSQIGYAALPNTYTIVVAGHNNESGPYTLSITQDPWHCMPDTIVGVPSTEVASTCYRGDRCSFSQGNDYMVQVNIDHAAQYTISMCDTAGQGANFDSYMTLSTQCCGGTVVAQNDNGCGYPGRSKIQCQLLSAGTYFLDIEPVYPYNFCGNFVLDISECPGENCATATVIPSLPYCTQGSTTGRVHDYDYPCGLPSPGYSGPDVVYRYTPSATQVISASTCGSSFNTVMSIFAYGCPGAGGIMVGCNNDDIGRCPPQSCLTLQVQAGVLYYIVLSGLGTAAGNFSFQVVTGSLCPGACDPCPYPNRDGEPVNNSCNAQDPPIACGDTLCGSLNTYLGDGGDFYTLQIPGPQCQTVTIDVFGNDTPGMYPFRRGLDPRVFLFSANCDTTLGMDDNGGYGNDARLVTACLQPGTYHVGVTTSQQSDSGRYILAISCHALTPCPPIDSLTIRPLTSPPSTLQLDFYAPASGFVRIYGTTSSTAYFPTSFSVIDSSHVSASGHYSRQVPVSGLYMRYVATVDSCGP